MRRDQRGFSLVELVIVIVIIGIIAAIAIPRVGRASRNAGESALSSNLAVLRNAIELYSSQHNGLFPGQNADGSVGDETLFIDQLTKYTKEDGTTNATYDAASGFTLGPYLRKGIPPAPVGAKKGNTGVKVGNSGPAVDAASDTGWVYNATTGDIIVNSDADNEAGSSTFDTY